MKTRFLVFVQLLPVSLSMLLLAAHVLRAGMMPLAVVLLLCPIGLLILKPVVARIFQMVLCLGAIEWVRTGLLAVSIREHNGQPWTRLAIILGGVAVFTLASSLVFFSKTLKNRYGSNLT